MAFGRDMDTNAPEKERHFVLIHGACHGAWCWYKVATILQSAGHRVTTLDLGASGINPKQVGDLSSMMDYVEPLFEFMGALPSGERVVLVGHSMGGAAVAMAMERFPEKIAVAAFAAAMMPGPDLGFIDITKEYSRRLDSNMDSKYLFGNGPNEPPTSFIFGHNFMKSKLYQLSPPEDFMLATYLLRPVCLFPDESVLQEQKAVTKERYGSVRRVYIVCNQDYVIKEDLQRWMIEKNPVDEVRMISGSDHMVMFCKPVELCSHLQEIAESYS
ncbi:salicylic acid-binding protein 2-like [Punica granatum]|uniref:Salicylic acid-binding protein 2-like n=2 Tax=Punica granatum TaxID=22663 RepID=A0A6P8CM55_PUNGR|nr:salicylic acid-binding protein 2-like [Punica granatum]